MRVSTLVILLVTLVVGCGPTPARPSPTPAASPTYVGSARCAACHQQEVDQWTGSQHDLAMQEPTPRSVLGNFDNATFTNFGLTSTFFKRGEEFWVRTDGVDGKLQEFRVRYVFGVYPLQQLLLELPEGKLQALSIAWDSRPKAQGGQRWYHLYPDEKITHEDVLHWTAMSQNWNHMCADCHSTNLHKNYRPNLHTYETTFSELNVSCEACHGPGSEHAQNPTPGPILGLVPPPDHQWIGDPKTGSPKHVDMAYTRQETQVCARCHSRRHQFSDDWAPGQPLQDAFLPALLDEDLYFEDGQQKDEVYNDGSFNQSKMFRAGVACSDCHEPHSLKLRAQGNALCVRCHQPDRFDTPAHTHHPIASAGSRCVECHAPTRTYMGIDRRRDHSFRVPRPDLTVRYGTPNACNQCHQDHDAAWAAKAVKSWFPGAPRPHFVAALHAAREGEPGWQAALLELAGDTEQSDMARATALAMLPTEEGLHDPNPLLRQAAVRGLENFPPNERIRLLPSLLGDPVRGVRIEAARNLADSSAQLSPEAQKELEAGIAEFLQAQLRNSDRPEAHLNRGLLLLAQGKPDQAEEAYREAIRVEPQFAPAYVNLADLLRERGQDDRAEPLIREGLKRCPEEGRAELYHTLGLLQVRQKNLKGAVESLHQAYRLRPADARLGVVYAVALQAAGRLPEATGVLRRVLAQHPYDQEALVTLVGYLGPNNKQALPYVKRLSQLQGAVAPAGP